YDMIVDRIKKILVSRCVFVIVFFFQAEDGIRDFHVTGVQTCALPIWHILQERDLYQGIIRHLISSIQNANSLPVLYPLQTRHHRSEERRVGKECRSGAWPYHCIRIVRGSISS